MKVSGLCYYLYAVFFTISVLLAVVLVMLSYTVVQILFEFLPYLRSSVFWGVTQPTLVVFFLLMCWDNSLVPTSRVRQSRLCPYFMLMMQCCFEGLFCRPTSHHPECPVANLEEVGSTYYTCVETRDRLLIF